MHPKKARVTRSNRKKRLQPNVRSWWGITRATEILGNDNKVILAVAIDAEIVHGPASMPLIEKRVAVITNSKGKCSERGTPPREQMGDGKPGLGVKKRALTHPVRSSQVTQKKEGAQSA